MLHAAGVPADATPPTHPDVEWARSELSEVASTLARVHERTATTIHTIEDENDVLRRRVHELEGTQAELRRVRAENARLSAKVAAMGPERDELVRERDALLRKLQNMRAIVRDLLSEGRGGPGINLMDDIHEDEAGSTTAASTRQSPPADAPAAPSLLEPPAEVTVPHSPRRRTSIVPDTHASPDATSAPRLSPPPQPRRVSAVPYAHSSPSFSPSSRPSRSPQPHPSTSTLGPPFTDARTRPGFPHPQPRVLSAALLGGSPVRGLSTGTRSMSLTMSPGMMSDGMSVHDEESAADGRAKWRIHFAKPPTTAKSVVGPVPFAELVKRLRLDEATLLAIEGLEGLPSDSLRLHISGDSAFLYDPVLLESPAAPYIVDWGRTKVIRNVAAYITKASDLHDALHTYMYSTKKTGWYYIGLQMWSIASVKPVWPILAAPAQRALASRRSTTMSAKDITRLLHEGELVQLAVELRSASGPEELKVLKKLRDK